MNVYEEVRQLRQRVADLERRLDALEPGQVVQAVEKALRSAMLFRSPYDLNRY